ncbi:MAG: VRR-NUC domain-containing protein [Faecalibacterium sp.]|nr:VRR-NUC domain-containing protein [Ruminococcus sp.]MCM1392274.1 VRR-NUC domain-containing protein [Ruminococcus sp.]MCM1485938.1 VRR-NUC domain-containing protein [Faecalibacterium sp.]
MTTEEFKAIYAKEDEEQALLFEWAKLHEGKYPELKAMYHVPNEGKRSEQQGAKMKSEGLKPGVPDICLPVSRGGYHSLYIELKREKGGRLTENQKTWIDMLRRLGNYAVCCCGSKAAEKVILWYLNLRDKI